MFNINIEYAMSNWVICQACIQRFIANLATDIRIVFGESKGYYVPKNAVPMQEVVKYLNIDIDYLESRSKNMKGDVKLA